MSAEALPKTDQEGTQFRKTDRGRRRFPKPSLHTQKTTSPYGNWLKRLLKHLYKVEDTPLAELLGGENPFFKAPRRLRYAHCEKIVSHVTPFIRKTLKPLDGPDAIATLKSRDMLDAISGRLRRAGYDDVVDKLKGMIAIAKESKASTDLKKRDLFHLKCEVSIRYPKQAITNQLKQLTGHNRCAGDVSLVLSVFLLHCVTLIQLALNNDDVGPDPNKPDRSSSVKLCHKGLLGSKNLTDLVLNGKCGFLPFVWENNAIWDKNHVHADPKKHSSGKIIKTSVLRKALTDCNGGKFRITEGTEETLQAAVVGILNATCEELARIPSPAKRNASDVVMAGRIIMGPKNADLYMSDVAVPIVFEKQVPVCVADSA